MAADAYAARAVAQCKDGIDNDGDGLKDYPADPGCSSRNDKSEKGTTACDNGINDDRDGLVDYPADPGCTSPSDVSELGTVQCDDNLDNDNDGATDYPADSLCSSATDNDEADRSCSDTDGGLVPAVQGTVSGSNNGQPFSYTDACITSKDLREWYCSGFNTVNFTANCGNTTAICVNGACTV